MFRAMSRKQKTIDDCAVKTLLQSARRSVLAINWDDGYPYTAPVDYVYDSDIQKIYFLGARVGYKADAL